jgi:hypothetical protein
MDIDLDVIKRMYDVVSARNIDAAVIEDLRIALADGAW